MENYVLQQDVMAVLKARVAQIIRSPETCRELLWSDEKGEQTHFICRSQWVLTALPGGAFMPKEATGIN